MQFTADNRAGIVEAFFPSQALRGVMSMSTPFAISCPHCAAVLKLKSNKFVGKKVPCPKCKQPFLVEEPPADEFLAGGDDDFGAMGDAPEEEPEEAVAPRSQGKSKGSSKGGKSKKKSKSGGGFAPIAMIGGGVVLGLGLLGGIVYGAMTLLSGAGNSNSWVKWLPDDTEVAIQMRVADSINAPIFKPITDNPTLSKLMNQPPLPGTGGADPAAAFFQGLGIQGKDVDTITIGLVNGIALIDSGRAGQQKPPQQFVAVVRLKAPVEEAKLGQAPTTVLAKEDYSGKSIYSVVGSQSPKLYMHSVDSTTYLLGSDAELKAAIDGRGKAPAAKRFAFGDTKSNFLFVAAPKDVSKLKSMGVTTVTAFSSGATTETGEVDGIRGISFGCTLGSDLIVTHCMSLSPSMAQPTADRFKTDVAAARPQLVAQMARMGGGFNPFVSSDMVTKLLGHVDTMLGTAQATASGSTATLTMTLSGQIVADGVQMATPFMPMLERLVKQQQAASGANPAMTGMTPGLGNSAIDVTSYPGMVINSGEQSKQKIADMSAQHNADLEAQMQEGGAAAAATIPGGQDRAAMAAMMKNMQAGAATAPAVVDPAMAAGAMKLGNGDPDAPNPAMAAGVNPVQAAMMKNMQAGGATAPAVTDPAMAAGAMTLGGDPDAPNAAAMNGAMNEQMRKNMQGANGKQAATEEGDGEKPAKSGTKSRSRRKTAK